MNLDEMIHRADSGDVEAMIWLCQYYNSRKNYDDFKRALAYGEKAAESGNLQGMAIATSGNLILAMIDANSQLGDYNVAAQKYIKAIHWSQLRITMANGDSKIIAEARRDNDKAQYGIACCYYFMNNYDEALRHILYLDTVQAKILIGCCYYTLAENMDDYHRAYTWLRVLENCKDYEMEISKQSQNEQEIYAKAVWALSTIYRIGIPGEMEENVNWAYQFLSNHVQNLDAEGPKAVLQYALQHYKKKIFGGYKYID